MVIYLLMVLKFINSKQKISVDYDATDVDDIKDIRKYLMKKNGII